ncbi:DUF5134 domain-containing protein [Actinomadura madurae]|uniref:DUF5134 domain-containing protein n=2 Tax=Actinomadura madurae TaxID=1993 RepID=A0A1I5KPC9_9ACTN|nr:DUF5134 domain-containing protein [Actinomadura madurae]SFO86960.1 hypothetical protein SAMN04489713_11091 [Actinomadura madurae]SPT49907.1 Uncharacterised protein [Actinomadura madurae]
MMNAPPVIACAVVVLMGSAGLNSLSRLRSRSPAPAPCDRDTLSYASDALMGLGAAVMALPFGLGMAIPAPLWVILFGAAALASLARLGAAGFRGARRRGRHLHDVVSHLSMVYMGLVMPAAAIPSPSTHHGQTHQMHMSAAEHSSGMPLLTGAFLLYFCAYTVWPGGRRPVQADHAPMPGTGHAVGGPDKARTCGKLMAVGMCVMLLMM